MSKNKPPNRPERPKKEHRELSWFDRFATMVSHIISRAGFFVFCVAMILIWLPTYFLFQDVNTWQLLINTATTIFTFLMVALLENTQARDSKAIHAKLNAMADALADLMEVHHDGNELRKDIHELREAVGLEDREGA